jgi:hypothetical protein
VHNAKEFSTIFKYAHNRTWNVIILFQSLTTCFGPYGPYGPMVSHSRDHCNYSTVFLVCTSSCLVAASNGGHSPSSGFPNCPRPHLPASHFSQLQLSPDSITTQSQNFLKTGGLQPTTSSWRRAPWDSKSKLCYDRWSVAQSVLVTSTHLGPMTKFLLLLSDSCGFYQCGEPSLTRGRVPSLQLLFGLTSAVILGSVSRMTGDHILLSQIWYFPNLEELVPYLYPLGKRVTQWHLQTLVFHQSQSHITTDSQSASPSWC